MICLLRVVRLSPAVPLSFPLARVVPLSPMPLAQVVPHVLFVPVLSVAPVVPQALLVVPLIPLLVSLGRICGHLCGSGECLLYGQDHIGGTLHRNNT
jgi:hypothetical protein